MIFIQGFCAQLKFRGSSPNEKEIIVICGPKLGFTGNLLSIWQLEYPCIYLLYTISLQKTPPTKVPPDYFAHYSNSNVSNRCATSSLGLDMTPCGTPFI